MTAGGSERWHYDVSGPTRHVGEAARAPAGGDRVPPVGGGRRSRQQPGIARARRSAWEPGGQRQR